MRRTIMIALIVSMAIVAQAGDHRVLSLAEGAAPAPARIADVAFVAGHWRGEALGGSVEEVWTAPSAGAMVGLFRLDRDGALAFSELLHITEEGGSLVLRLKHFNPDLESWEEQGSAVARRLVRIEPGIACFDGLTFQRIGANGLEAVVLMGEGETRREMVFRYQRLQPAVEVPAEPPTETLE